MTGSKVLIVKLPELHVDVKALEAFQKAADGKATKIIIPSEIQGLAGLAAGAQALLEKDPPAEE